MQLEEFDYTVMVEESTQAASANILTHQFREKKEKKESKSLPPLPPPSLKEIEQAFALYFDGAYKRKEGRAAAGIVLFNPLKEKVMERGMVLLNVSSNTEAKYAALIVGLEWCVSNEVNQLNVYGDSILLLNKCKGFGLVKVTSLLPSFER